MSQVKDIMLTCRVRLADLRALETIASVYGLCRSEALRRAIRTAAGDRGLTDEENNKEIDHGPN